MMKSRRSSARIRSSGVARISSMSSSRGSEPTSFSPAPRLPVAFRFLTPVGSLSLTVATPGMRLPASTRVSHVARANSSASAWFQCRTGIVHGVSWTDDRLSLWRPHPIGLSPGRRGTCDGERSHRFSTVGPLSGRADGAREVVFAVLDDPYYADFELVGELLGALAGLLLDVKHRRDR